MDWVDELYRYCEKQGQRKREEIEEEYLNRLKHAINTAVLKPSAIPRTTISREECKEWIDISDFRLEEGFDFYHHTKEDLYEYTIQNRGNADIHLYAMRNDGQVWVEEYPKPDNKGKAYIISQNGNHRSLVFYSMGLKYIEANVQKMEGDTWWYYWKYRNPYVLKVFIWFMNRGLIDNVRFLDGDTILFDGKNSLAGWILPNAEGSLFRMIHEIKKRLELVKKAFPEVDKMELHGLDTKSVFRLYFEMRLKLKEHKLFI